MAIKNTHVAGDAIKAVDMNDTVTGLSGFATHQQATPDLTLKVEPGVANLKGKVVKFAGGNSPSFAAPSVDPRIDLLVMDDTGTLSLVSGAESPSPTPPDFPDDKFVIVEVKNVVGQTKVLNADDSSNGFIFRNVRNAVVPDIKQGGDGSDGALVITSGTTTFDLAGADTFVKNFTSISITGTGQLAFINPGPNGTAIIFKSQGDVTITSSATDAIDVSSLGAVADTNGFSSTFRTSAGVKGAVGIIASNVSGGIGGVGQGAFTKSVEFKVIRVSTGAGGATGGNGATGAAGGAGGRGGGAMYIECGGALNWRGWRKRYHKQRRRRRWRRWWFCGRVCYSFRYFNRKYGNYYQSRRSRRSRRSRFWRRWCGRCRRFRYRFK